MRILLKYDASFDQLRGVIGDGNAKEKKKLT